MKKLNCKEAVRKYLKNCGPQRFSGWELARRINGETGLNTYPETILHHCRNFAHGTGAVFICLDKTRSYYEYLPGEKTDV
jgi:hypothetical protein